MMLARVADSLYWIGRYVERAEHMSRITDVMLNANLDEGEAARDIAAIAVASVGDRGGTPPSGGPYEAAVALALDRQDPGSILSSLARARENARQVRDHMTTETWEQLNLLHLRLTAVDAGRAFSDSSSRFLHELIADLHLFKGAVDATMSHGEGWRFLVLGAYLERAQLIGRLLQVFFADGGRRALAEHQALTSLLRMSCALEPYLKAHTADLNPRTILQFLLFDEDFPRSIRFCTSQIEQHL
ncbi:MAG TPA: alpha-E domain-containing protein, partial [Phenylobacterium sp.]